MSIMDWVAEANAVIKDARPYVHAINVAQNWPSTNMRIYFEITTLERQTIFVSMDANGFTVCDEKQVYETINALLSNYSPRYRETFAQSLMDKVKEMQE